MNWRLRILTKMVLSRLPFNYALWQRIGLFKLGKMEQLDYAPRIFSQHKARAFPDGIEDGYSVLELGPGDSIAGAIVAKAHGAGKIWLVDIDRYAVDNMALYRKIAGSLRGQGLNAPDLSNAKDMKDVLRLCNATYLTKGMESLRALPDSSIDMIWSQSVVEHIGRDEFDATMREIARLLSSDKGRATHHVDMKDHLGGALNNLRFSDNVWFSPFFVKSGFYTNRLRCHDVKARMEGSGLATVALDCTRWEKLPTPRDAMDEQFKALPEDELNISSFRIVSRKAA